MRRDGMVVSAVACTVANAGAVAATGRNSCDDTGVNPLYTPPSPGGRSHQENERFSLETKMAFRVLAYLTHSLSCPMHKTFNCGY